MPEIISCPGCQRKLQVPETYVGQQVQCPSCKAMFTAASSAAPFPVTAAPAPTPRPADPSPRQDWKRGREQEEDLPRRRGRDLEEERPRRRDRYGEDYDDDRPGYRRRRDFMPHRGSTILTLGILSFFVCWPILGPMAWIMGNTDLREMQTGRMDPEGESSTKSGKICGMVSVIIHLCIIGIVILILLISAAVAPRGRF